MIYDEINKTTKYYQEHIKELELSIKTKEESLKYSRTPIEECYRYLELEQLIKKSVNKKRKEYERELKGLSDQYKFIHHDLISVGVISTLKQQRDKEKDSLKNQQTFIELKTTAICKVLEKEGFIEKIENDDGWKFTNPHRYTKRPHAPCTKRKNQSHGRICQQASPWRHRGSYDC